VWLNVVVEKLVARDNAKLIDKFKECQDENKQLKETKIQLEAEILNLKAENEELHKAIENLGGERTSVLEPKD
jgi:predicted nuclease with TOPRIM domain